MTQESKTDPFFDDERCVERLYEVYKKYGRIIVAYDFDDTVYDCHNKDYTFPTVTRVLRDSFLSGAVVLCVYTASQPERFDMIQDYLGKHNIPFTHFNQSPVEWDNVKMYYNLLLDDKAGLLQAVRILEKFLFKVRLEKIKLGFTPKITL